MSKAGVISGVPNETGRFPLNISAVNSGGKASRRFTLRVSENAAHEYVTAAVLPALSVSADGAYDFTVSIDQDIPAGSYIEWHPFPNGIETDGGNYSFSDSSGKETITVPEDHRVKVKAYLEGIVSYEPVITARVRVKKPESQEASPENPGKQSGCNVSGAIGVIVLASAAGIMFWKE